MCYVYIYIYVSMYGSYMAVSINIGCRASLKEFGVDIKQVFQRILMRTIWLSINSSCGSHI